MKQLINLIPDLLLVIGALVIVLATFLLNVVAGLYVLGVLLFVAGIFVDKDGIQLGRKRG
ncbi:DUF1056 family protein [Priestia megaterium]